MYKFRTMTDERDAAGKPIIMAVEGGDADLVVQAGVGYVCASEDARAMADCVNKLVK